MDDSAFCLRGSSGSFRYSEISDALSVRDLLFGIFKEKSLFPKSLVEKFIWLLLLSEEECIMGWLAACLYFSFISIELNATLAAALAYLMSAAAVTPTLHMMCSLPPLAAQELRPVATPNAPPALEPPPRQHHQPCNYSAEEDVSLTQRQRRRGGGGQLPSSLILQLHSQSSV